MSPSQLSKSYLIMSSCVVWLQLQTEIQTFFFCGINFRSQTLCSQVMFKYFLLCIKRVNDVHYILLPYQTSHFCSGLIAAPSGHWNSSENSFKLLKGPFTLNSSGECASRVICCLSASGLDTEHHVCAAEIQNS